MHIFHHKHIHFPWTVLVVAFVLAAVFSVLTSSASTTDGTINAALKYAWGDKMGYINFGVPTGNVHVTDTELTGYAWSDNYGWISLNCSNTGTCGTGNYKVTNNGEGDLGGYAWSEGMGYIDFTNATINTSGDFGGTATGTVAGTINFACGQCQVNTDWRPASVRASQGGGGGGSGGSGGPAPAPPTDNTAPVNTGIVINAGAAETSVIAVTLALQASDASLPIEMQIANDVGFTGSVWEPLIATKSWSLTSGNGLKTVYARYRDSVGNISATVNDTITLNVTDTTPPTSPGIVIANGVSEVSSTTVTLTLEAVGATEMMIGNDNTFTGSVWEPYATSKAWTLASGQGAKTVFAKYRDDAGNESTIVSDGVTLTVPVVPTPTPTPTPQPTPTPTPTPQPTPTPTPTPQPTPTPEPGVEPTPTPAPEPGERPVPEPTDSTPSTDSGQDSSPQAPIQPQPTPSPLPEPPGPPPAEPLGPVIPVPTPTRSFAPTQVQQTLTPAQQFSGGVWSAIFGPATANLGVKTSVPIQPPEPPRLTTGDVIRSVPVMLMNFFFFFFKPF